MNILSYLLPQVLLRTSSPHNNDIKVQEFQGFRSLIVNGIPQTSPYDARIFDKAFRAFSISSVHVTHALIMGVGGGYVIKKLQKLFPKVKITAVDIDSIIIDIAKRYFFLDSVHNTEYIVSDAQLFVSKTPKKVMYDFILIDLYIGDDIPDFVSQAAFFKKISLLLSKTGVALINYQGIESYEHKRHKLNLMLQKVFHSVKYKKIERNVFFLLKK